MEMYYILFFPFAAGIIVALVNSISINKRLDTFISWTEKKKSSISSESSKFTKYLTRPACLSILTISKWTNEIKNEGLKNGTRLTAFLYVGYIFAYILAAIGFVILFLIVFILFIWLILKLTLFKNDDETPVYRRSANSYDRDNLLELQHYNRERQKTGYSEEKSTIFGGTKLEHFDNNLKNTGYTTKERDFLGCDYEQHYNREGKKIGKSQKESGILGTEYLQHYDDEGNQIGYSKTEEHILGGEYIVHYDQSGKKIGESEIRE